MRVYFSLHSMSVTEWHDTTQGTIYGALRYSWQWQSDMSRPMWQYMEHWDTHDIARMTSHDPGDSIWSTQILITVTVWHVMTQGTIYGALGSSWQWQSDMSRPKGQNKEHWDTRDNDRVTCYDPGDNIWSTQILMTVTEWHFTTQGTIYGALRYLWLWQSDRSQPRGKYVYGALRYSWLWQSDRSQPRGQYVYGALRYLWQWQSDMSRPRGQYMEHSDPCDKLVTQLEQTQLCESNSILMHFVRQFTFFASPFQRYSFTN